MSATGHISDGYHTFDELYDHRITLFIALARMFSRSGEFPVWRSYRHSDGGCFEGWFVLGVFKEKCKQITYHLPASRWSETDFAEELQRAPEWDGHSSADVIERLKEL